MIPQQSVRLISGMLYSVIDAELAVRTATLNGLTKLVSTWASSSMDPDA